MKKLPNPNRNLERGENNNTLLNKTGTKSADYEAIKSIVKDRFETEFAECV